MAAGDLSPDSATCQPEVEVNFLKLLLEKKEEKRSVESLILNSWRKLQKLLPITVKTNRHLDLAHLLNKN